jgi:DNA-binding MarR family transcriptional regulator
MEKTSFDQLLMDVIREMGVLRPEQVLPGWSLSLSEIYALNILAEQAPLSQQELGAALLLEKSSVTRLVQQLEQRGWVTRERDPRDSRLRLLRLSEPGQQMTDEMHADQVALIQGLTALKRAFQHTSWKPGYAEKPHIRRTE